MFRLVINLHTRVIDIYNICVIFSGLQKDFYKLWKYSPHKVNLIKAPADITLGALLMVPAVSPLAINWSLNWELPW